MQTVNVVLRGRDLALPKDLHERLKMLAEMNDETVEEYLEYIVSHNQVEVDQWKQYPEEAHALLQIFSHSFSELKSTFTALKNIQEK